IIAHELEVLGSHGMQAHKFDEVFRLIGAGRLQPEKLVGRTITLQEALTALPEMNSFEHQGVTVIDRF
ncbi:MAG: alcohol dehydrogenase, partial [Desulfocapsaceae bacterium]